MNKENLNFQSVVHLTLIQILEKLSKVIFYSSIILIFLFLNKFFLKIQEFSSNLNRSDEYNSISTELFNTITDYFIQANDSDNNVFKEKHNFYICSILIRRVCSTNLAKQNTDELLTYFNVLFKYCMKIHKEILKNISSK